MRPIDADAIVLPDDLPYKASVKRVLLQAPTIDAVPVVHGRWEWQEEWETHPELRSCDLLRCGWYCTECGIELGDYLSEKSGRYICLDDDYIEPKLMYCPNCGAKMDGGKDNAVD